MSPRAAWRLETLGFARVFDYAAGKTDWTGSGLPVEGEMAFMPRPGMIAAGDIPTCSVSDRIGDVTDDLQKRGGKVCIVIAGDGIVLGRLRSRELKSDPDARAGDVMESGPTTVRYDEFLPALTQRMQDRGVGSILVTTPEGKLIGIMYRDDAERLLKELDLHHDHDHEHHDHEQHDHHDDQGHDHHDHGHQDDGRRDHGRQDHS